MSRSEERQSCRRPLLCRISALPQADDTFIAAEPQRKDSTTTEQKPPPPPPPPGDEAVKEAAEVAVAVKEKDGEENSAAYVGAKKGDGGGEAAKATAAAALARVDIKPKLEVQQQPQRCHAPVNSDYDAAALVASDLAAQHLPGPPPKRARSPASDVARKSAPSGPGPGLSRHQLKPLYGEHFVKRFPSRDGKLALRTPFSSEHFRTSRQLGVGSD